MISRRSFISGLLATAAPAMPVAAAARGGGAWVFKQIGPQEVFYEYLEGLSQTIVYGNSESTPREFTGYRPNWSVEPPVV